MSITKAKSGTIKSVSAALALSAVAVGLPSVLRGQPAAGNTTDQPQLLRMQPTGNPMIWAVQNKDGKIIETVTNPDMTVEVLEIYPDKQGVWKQIDCGPIAPIQPGTFRIFGIAGKNDGSDFKEGILLPGPGIRPDQVPDLSSGADTVPPIGVSSPDQSDERGAPPPTELDKWMSMHRNKALALVVSIDVGIFLLGSAALYGCRRLFSYAGRKAFAKKGNGNNNPGS